MRHFIAFFIAVVIFTGCFETGYRPLLKNSPYDTKFNYYAKRLSGKKQKLKHLKKMEQAYQSAQKSDLLAADSLINLDKPDRWLYVHAYYQRLQTRQEKVLGLMPFKTKAAYKPELLIIGNLNEKELASKEAAAAYLYDLASRNLAKGTHAGARAAYSSLDQLHVRYFPAWENSIALMDSALQSGIEHVLVQHSSSISLRMPNSKWQKFYDDSSDRPAFDIIISTSNLSTFVSHDAISSSSVTETKKIEVGYKEKKDSTGAVVERTPIYESVSATITETTIEKHADASIYMEVQDAKTGGLIYAAPISSSYYYSDKSVAISGDKRALSSCVTASHGSISIPNRWVMEDAVLDLLESDIRRRACSQLWKDD